MESYRKELKGKRILGWKVIGRRPEWIDGGRNSRRKGYPDGKLEEARRDEKMEETTLGRKDTRMERWRKEGRRPRWKDKGRRE